AEAGARRLPRARVAADAIDRALADHSQDLERASARLAWLGGPATPSRHERRTGLTVVGRHQARFVPLTAAQARFVRELLDAAPPRSGRPRPRLPELGPAFPGGPAAFARFLVSPAWRALEELALVRLP